MRSANDSDSQLRVQESIALEFGDLSPLCVRGKRKRRQVAALHGTDEDAGESELGIIHPIASPFRTIRSAAILEENALLVEPVDSVAMAAALRSLLLDEELREQLRQRGHSLYRDRFSAEALTSALAELYLSLGFTAPSE